MGESGFGTRRDDLTKVLAPNKVRVHSDVSPIERCRPDSFDNSQNLFIRRVTAGLEQLANELVNGVLTRALAARTT